jgi:putative membrane protein
MGASEGPAAQQVKAEPAGASRVARPMPESADRRTVLAADRTVLAAERTYAAWVRTGLAALASGVGAKKVLEGVLPEWGVVLTGSVLVLFSAACFAAAVWRELWPDINAPQPEVRRLPRPLLLALNGFLMLVALAALFGVWFGETGG